jgi:hypothetical protein
MLKSRDFEFGCLEFTLNPREIRRDHNEINVHGVDRFDVAIHCQSANQTPRFISIQHNDEFGEIARPTARYRFVHFSRSHMRSQVTKPPWHCQLAAPRNRRKLNRHANFN